MEEKKDNLSHECYMQEKIEQVDRKCDQILIALKGDDLGNPGILPRLARADKEISGLKNFRLKITTKAGVIISTISTILSLLVTYLFTKINES